MDKHADEEFAEPQKRMSRNLERSRDRSCVDLSFENQQYAVGFRYLAYAFAALLFFFGFLGFVFSLVTMGQIGVLREQILALTKEVHTKQI